ncbi:MAG: sulfotransferase family 2 domain-containing protein [Hyphomicrobium sp.]|jgi:hypothetical protein
MRVSRRGLRNYLGRYIGIQADLNIWWTPGLPVVYVANPKAGCSSIQHSLKAAQADAYARVGRVCNRVSDPHTDDDCLRSKGLSPSRCRDRTLFAVVRNPFARALSGYLDKAFHLDHREFRELRHLKTVSFEAFLRAVAAYDRHLLDDHFRPQHINLHYPALDYDSIFYLEHPAPIGCFLEKIAPDFKFERFSPHARGALEKLSEYYNPTTFDLVREIYAEDFDLFGYSRNLEDALLAPGVVITDGRVQMADDPQQPDLVRPLRDTRILERTLRMRWLIERRFI